MAEDSPQLLPGTLYLLILRIAEVPELPGCAADGPTRQEALANAEIVMSEWLETARELGRLVPEPKGRLLFA